MSPETTPKDGWNPALYVGQHSFVYELGQALVDLANVQPGERLLDVGCGTGQLTAELAKRGANVVGLDISPAMIDAAREAYPALNFEVGDASTIKASDAFDVVFSNATLHWVKQSREAAQRMAGAMRPGGRFVAEFGGSGNVEIIRTALGRALESLDLGPGAFDNPWFNPTLAEYVETLSEAGLEVAFAHLFQRPTPLDGPDGLLLWLEMFARPQFVNLEPDAVSTVFERAVEVARSDLYRDGTWYADYVRLRVMAVRPPWDAKSQALTS